MARKQKPDEQAIAKCVTQPERVNQVFRWMLSGASEQDIEEAIKANWPDADIGPLIVTVVERLEAAGDLNHQLIRGWCVEAMRDLYRRMVEIGDFAGALRAVKEIHGLTSK